MDVPYAERARYLAQDVLDTGTPLPGHSELLPDLVSFSYQQWCALPRFCPAQELKAARNAYLEELGGQQPYLTLLLLTLLQQLGRWPQGTAPHTARLAERYRTAAGQPPPAASGADCALFVQKYRNHTDRFQRPALPAPLDLPAEAAAAGLLLGQEDITRTALDAAAQYIYTCKAEGDLTERQWELIQNNLASRFAFEVRSLLTYVPGGGTRAAEVQVAFYRLCYELLPCEWSESIVYNGYGDKILLEGAPPAALLELAKRALAEKRLRYADLLLKLFPQVQLADLGRTAGELLQTAFATEDSNLFRGLLLAERMMLPDEEPVASLDRWWGLVQALQRPDNPAWQEQKDWFTMYYLCTRIARAPQQASQTMDRVSRLPEITYHNRKTNTVQQAAFEALFFCSQKNIQRFLYILGENNVFRLQPEESRPPYFELTPLVNRPDSAVQGLLAQGYGPTEIVRIYMNTHLRCCYDLGRMLMQLIESGQALGPVAFMEGRKGLRISGLLAPYTLMGDLGAGSPRKSQAAQRGNRMRYGIIPRSYNLQGAAPLLDAKTGLRMIPLTKEWQDHADLCEQLRSQAKPVRFCPQWISTADRLMLVSPVAEPWMQEVVLGGVKPFCRELEAIAQSGEFGPEERRRLRMCAPRSLHRLDARYIRRIGVLTVQCCAALAGNMRVMHSFLELINELDNPYRYIPPGSRRFMTAAAPSSPEILTREQLERVRDSWQQLFAAGITMRRSFFVYINTIFHCCYPLWAWAEHFVPPDSRFLDMLPVVASEHAKTTYWLPGFAQSLSDDSGGEPGVQSLCVLPINMYSGSVNGPEDRFALRLDDPQARAFEQYRGACAFVPSVYVPEQRMFYLREICPADDFAYLDPHRMFMKALDQAATSITMTQRTLEGLAAPAGLQYDLDLPACLQSFLQAVRLRAGDLPALEEFLSAVAANNLFAYQPSVDINLRSKISVKSLTPLTALAVQTLHLIADQGASPERLLAVFFNTPLRYIISLNSVISIFLQDARGRGGVSPESFVAAAEAYPLVFRLTGERLRPLAVIIKKNGRRFWGMPAYPLAPGTVVTAHLSGISRQPPNYLLFLHLHADTIDPVP